MGEKPVFRIGCLNTGAGSFSGFLNAGTRFDHFYLEPVLLGSWTQLMERLCDRRIDGAFIPVPAAIDLVGAGVEIRLLLKKPMTPAIFIKNRVANIKRLIDFRGKTILVPHGLSIYTLLVHRLMAAIGLRFGVDDSADVFFESMPESLMAEALAHDDGGRIGGFIGPEPFGTMAVEAGVGERVCQAEKLWPGYPSDVFVLGTPLVDSFVEGVYELVAALVRSFSAPRHSGRDSVGSPGADFQGFSASDFLIEIKTIRLIERYMGEAFGYVAQFSDVSRAVQMDFAMKTGAGI